MRSLRRPRASRAGLVVLTGALVLAVLGLGSCSVVRDQVRGIPEVDASVVSTGFGALATVEWDVVDGGVVVLAENQHDQLLRHADAVFTLRDAAGDPIGTHDGPCCEATGVAPGARVGFWLATSSTEDVAGVEVAYENVSWAPDAGVGWPSVSVSDPQLVTAGDATEGAAVVGVATSTGGLVPRAVVLAVVDDADGDLLTVVTREVTCLQAGAEQGLRMPTDAPLPPDARLRSVETFAQPPPPPGAVDRTDVCAEDG